MAASAKRTSTASATREQAKKTSARSGTRSEEVGIHRSRAECRFYLAEDVREEKGNKLTAVGLFTDHIVVLEVPVGTQGPSREKPFLLGSVVVVANLASGAGSHTYSVKVRDPTGDVVSRPAEPRTVTVAPVDSSMNVLMRFQPLPIYAFGQVKITLTVDEVPYEYQFELRRRDVAVHGATITADANAAKSAMKQRSKVARRRRP